MKSISLIASLCLMLYAPSELQALSTSSYTFVPVCTPSVTVLSLSSTRDCFSLSSSVLHPSAPESYYSWNFGDGTATETGSTLNHCYASETVPGNTTRTVTLSYFNTDLNCAGSATATLQVSVMPGSGCPVAPPAFSLAATTVTVWANSVIPEIVTSYDFGDGTAPTSNAIHTYTACGNYIVRVSSWDMNMPHRICDSYVAINISCSVPTGIPEISAVQSVSVFPNPASDLMHVKAHEPVKNMMVTDVLGKTILSQTEVDLPEPVLRIGHLPAGTYFIYVGLKSGAHKTLLFIKH